MPLGIIISPNSNLLSADSWALVLDGIVINTILDTTLDILSSPIVSSYDYIVDMTMLGQFAGPGDGYNPSNKTFIYPPTPPPDYNEYTQNDFYSVSSTITQCLMDASNLSSSQIQAAFAAATEDAQADYSPNQANLMIAIYNFIVSGG